MPKQQLKIEQFHGGLNTDSDPRDIADNEFSALQGLSVSNLGKIVSLGEHVDSGYTYLSEVLDISSATNSINEGYGLFQFSSDYDDASALVSTDYVALYDANNGYLSIYDGADADTSWNNDNSDPSSTDGIPTALDSDTTAPTSTTNGTPNFYAPNGILRICDGTFSNVNRVPKWYGVPDKKVLAPGVSNQSIGGAWHTANASIEETTYRNVEPGSGTKAPRANLIMADEPDDAGTVNSGSGAVSRFIHHFAPQSNETSNRATWGTHLNFVEASDNSGTWQPDTGTTYRFYATFVYDGIQESQPKTFMMHPSQTDSSNNGLTTVDEIQFWDTATDDAQTNTASGNFSSNCAIYFNVGCRWTGNLGASSDFNFGNRNTVGTGDIGNKRITGTRIYWASNEDGFSNLYLLFDCDFEKGSIGMGRAGGGGVTGRTPWANTTDLSSNTMKMDTTSSTRVNDPPKFETYESLNGYKHDTKLDAKWKTSVVANGRTYIGNIKRKQKSTFNCTPFTDDSCVVTASDATITHDSSALIKPGMIVYGYSGIAAGSYVKSVTNLTSFEMNQNPDNAPAEVNVTFDDYSGTVADTVRGTTDSTANHKLETGDVIKITTSPNNDAYTTAVTVTKIDASTFHFPEATFDAGETDGSFKIQLSFDGNGWSPTQADDPEYQDRIVKSPVDRFDTFPEDENHEIEIFGANDGDSIIKLETFADRLFVFKKKTLQILNISNDREMLEGAYPYLGLDGGYQHQSVVTDHGIAWINSNGVYFYDGNNIEPLIDNKIENLWKGQGSHSEAFWLQHADDIPTIGYEPSSKKLIISKNISGANSDADVLIYDFKLKAWVNDLNAFTANYGKTNFVVYKNQMIWAQEGADADDIEFKKFTPDTPAAQAISMKTKDFDFGAPAVRKKIYKVYVSYKGDGSSVSVQYGINGETDDASDLLPFYRTNSDGSSDGTNSDTTPLLDDNDKEHWINAELKPVASINNVYSFHLVFGGTCNNTDFEINDITIIYRMKNIK